jgi:glycerophosphoryl diester phosphodiesterase
VRRLTYLSACMHQVLLDHACAQELVIDSGLKEVAAYADGIGPDKGILAPAPGGIISFTTDFVKRCVHLHHLDCLTAWSVERTTLMAHMAHMGLTHGHQWTASAALAVLPSVCLHKCSDAHSA